MNGVSSRIYIFALIFIIFNISMNILTNNPLPSSEHSVTIIAGFPSSLNPDSSLNSTRYFAQLVLIQQNETIAVDTNTTSFVLPKDAKVLATFYLPFSATHSISELESTSVQVKNTLSDIPVLSSFISKPAEVEIHDFLANYSNDIYAQNTVKIDTILAISNNYCLLFTLYKTINTTTELVSLQKACNLQMSNDYIVIALDPNSFKFNILQFTPESSALSQFKLALDTVMQYLKPVPIPIEPLNTIYNIIYVLLIIALILPATLSIITALKP